MSEKICLETEYYSRRCSEVFTDDSKRGAIILVSSNSSGPINKKIRQIIISP
jgi:hypothetical protein